MNEAEQFDIPILLIFFNRPDTFSQVFKKIRQLKPKYLFLAQDGPRNEKDKEKIMECQEIAKNIDWDCKVMENYSVYNLGCGEKPAGSISWAFEHTDKLIILEDDCIPADSFYQYCKELLLKYENDTRVAYISGLNHFGEWDCGDSSYFFARSGAIGGWATWRRSWKLFDYYVDNIEDKYTYKLLENDDFTKSKIEIWEGAQKSKATKKKLSYWDMQWGFVKYSQNQLVVVPKVNQIKNIGIGEASTHAKTAKESKWVKYKSLVYIPTQNIEFPLVHPKSLMCDYEYDNLFIKIFLSNNVKKKIKKFFKKIKLRVSKL